MWPSEIGRVVREEIGGADWEKFEATVRTLHAVDVGDLDKNPPFLGYLLTEAWENDKRSGSLETLCRALLKYAASQKR